MTTMAPWEALITDQGNLSALKTEEVDAQIVKLQRMLETLDAAEAKRLAVATKNSNTMKTLHAELERGDQEPLDRRSAVSQCPPNNPHAGHVAMCTV